MRPKARWRSWTARKPECRCARPPDGRGSRGLWGRPHSCGPWAPTPSLLRIATTTTLIDVAIPLSLIARYAAASAAVRTAAAVPAQRCSATVSSAKAPSLFCVRGDAYARSLTRASGKQQLLATFAEFPGVSPGFTRKPQKRQPTDARRGQNALDCQKRDSDSARPLRFVCSFCGLASSYIGARWGPRPRGAARRHSGARSYWNSGHSNSWISCCLSSSRGSARKAFPIAERGSRGGVSRHRMPETLTDGVGVRVAHAASGGR